MEIKGDLHAAQEALRLLSWPGSGCSVRAFRQDRRWGFGTLDISRRSGVIFAGRHPRKGGVPLGITCLIWLLGRCGSGALHAFRPAGPGTDEKKVPGEKHLTLTGSDPKDCPDLKQKQTWLCSRWPTRT